jgi:hypothetical protein
MMPHAATRYIMMQKKNMMPHDASCCNTLHHDAKIMMPHAATSYITMQKNMMPHAATSYITMQKT